jgi:hypothetical protein
MVNTILPTSIQRFRNKSSDYGDVFKELGLAGQYSDMHRKMHKLKKVMWEGRSLKGEQAEEILHDLLGNILISLWLLANDEETKDSGRRELGPRVKRVVEGRASGHDDGEASQGAASAQPVSGQDTGAQRATVSSEASRARQQEADAVRKSSPS